MKTSTQSLRRRPIRPTLRRGLTLIEVVAGLALMATLLVAMLLLKTRFTHQLADSNEHLRAVAAADSLLEQWWADPAKFPINRFGSITDYPNFEWHTQQVDNQVVSRLDSRVVRLDIVTNAKIVTSVELMLPQPHHHAQ